EAGVGVVTLACFALLGPWLPALQIRTATATLRATESLAAGFGVQMALPPLVLLFVPTVLLGMAFPAAARLACGADRIGRDVGAVAAANTFGGIAGTLLTGFVAVPLLGVCHTLATLTAGAAAVGGVAILRGAAARHGRVRWRVAAAVTAGVVAVAVAGA